MKIKANEVFKLAMDSFGKYLTLFKLIFFTLFFFIRGVQSGLLIMVSAWTNKLRILTISGRIETMALEDWPLLRVSVLLTELYSDRNLLRVHFFIRRLLFPSGGFWEWQVVWEEMGFIYLYGASLYRKEGSSWRWCRNSSKRHLIFALTPHFELIHIHLWLSLVSRQFLGQYHK